MGKGTSCPGFYHRTYTVEAPDTKVRLARVPTHALRVVFISVEACARVGAAEKSLVEPVLPGMVSGN